MVSMRSLATAGLLLGLLPLAAACGGATATHSVTLHHTGTPELFRYAAGGEDQIADDGGLTHSIADVDALDRHLGTLSQSQLRYCTPGRTQSIS